MGSNDYCTQVVTDLGQVDRAAWDALVLQDGAGPFLRHDFLHALAASGSVGGDSGWSPQFIVLREGDALVAAAPLYEKAHSYGEYVFDWAWAEAYQRYGMRYYPKGLVAVPFTPVGGARLLARDAAARGALLDALLAHANSQQWSSLHVLFARDYEMALLAERGLLMRQGVQFHWHNRGWHQGRETSGHETSDHGTSDHKTTGPGTRTEGTSSHDNSAIKPYADFDDFLAALTQPKRKKIRAERRKVHDAGITLVRKVGREITEADWRHFHHCYCTTYAAHWSTPYLNLEFFLRIGASMPEHLMLVVAEQHGTPLAASLGVFDATRLYGRYWGTLQPVDCLHFEACYYQMIDFAIERGLMVFEGGAQGAHKLARGLDPVPTASAHWIAHPQMRAAIGRFVERESDGVEHTIEELNEHRAFRESRGQET